MAEGNIPFVSGHMRMGVEGKILERG